MQQQALAWLKAAKVWINKKRPSIHRVVICTLVAPIIFSVSAPESAQAAFVAASDTTCSQEVNSATGVTVIRSGNDCIVTFAAPSNTTTSNTWKVPSYVTSVQVLVIGGGGSGGTRHAGGGGAGGFVYNSSLSVTSGVSLSVTAGAGGASVSGSASNGNSGASSVFGSITAYGGGFGGQTTAGGSGATVGSAGGSCCATAAGTSSSGQGNNGGKGTQSNIEAGWSGGGGGGAGGVGGSSTSSASIDSTNWTAGNAIAGAGGQGSLNSITGASVCYAAGGGGGSGGSGSSVGLGGQCSNGTTVGGAGTTSYTPNAGQGTDGTGSGGGGAGFVGGTNGTSGRGGSGVVIVRYTVPLFTVTFNANSGSGAAASASVSQVVTNAYGAVTLSAQGTLSRAGFTFGGWNTAADGSGTNYSAGASYTPTSNITLFARWYPLATFNGNGYTTDISTVPAPQSITSVSALNTLPIPYSLRKNTYRFGGWNTNETGTGTNSAGNNVDIYDLKEPYLRLEAANYNTTTNVWTATNGANVPASKVKSPANITKVLNTNTSGFGGTETFTALRGTAAAGIALGNASLAGAFTFCAVARPTAVQSSYSTATGGRIFDGVTGNWLAGWWSGYQASFYHEGWMNNSTTPRTTNFHVLCDRPASSRFDGTQVGTTGSGSTTLPEISINNGNYSNGSTISPANTTETTPWEVAEIIIYNRTLSDVDVLKVESYFKYRYGVTAATNGSYTLGSATTTYQTSSPQTLYAQWNSVIVYDANGGTGTAPANTTISGTGGALASNTGNLANGANAFLGWYTNSSGTGGTFYAAGATFPNTGSRTLYAVYGPALSISGGTTASFATGTGGRSETYTVSGGAGIRTVTNTVSPVNTGITLDTSTSNSLVINVSSLVPIGTYYDTITIRDDGFLVTKTIAISVVAPLTWSSTNATTVVTTFGKTTRTRLDLSGGTGTRVATITHASSPSPRGISIDTSTISSGYITLITDTGTAAGTYLESITVTDSTRVVRTALITITINAPPDISYTSLTDAPYPYRTNNLVLNVDLSNPSSYSGTGQTLRDVSATGKTFTFYNGSDAVTNGIFAETAGGVISQDGTNLYAQSTSLPSMDTFTVETWINLRALNATNEYRMIVTDMWTTAGDKINYALGTCSTAGEICGSFFDGSSWVAYTTFRPSINTWYHLAYVVGGTTGSHIGYLYVNGVLVSTSATTASNPTTSNRGLRIGRRWDSAQIFNGLIGSVRIYNTALSGTQIRENYANTKARFVSLSSAAPTNSGSATFTMTEGKSATYQIFAETGGTGTNTFTLSGTNSTMSLASVGTDQTSLVVSSAITATNTTTAKTYYETLTATDSSTAATAYYLTITVNPKIVITAATDTLTTTFGKAAYDTITASRGTGNLTFTRTSGSGSSAITAPVTGNQALLTAAATLPVGTYYETFTVTDSVSATTVKVITIIVNPAPTLTSATGVNTLETTYSKAASLTINVANGTGTRTASALPVTISGVSLTTTNLQNGTLVLALNTSVAVGRYTETITVTDSATASASIVITIIVNAAPTISYAGATSGAITFVTTKGGSLQSGAFTAANGTGIKTLTLSGANTGISVDTTTANTGVVTFGPLLGVLDTASARTYYETMTVTDSLSVTSTRAFTITVNPPIIETATVTSLATTSGIETSTVIYASKGTGPISFSRTGTSTSGITLTSGTNQATLRVLSTINPGTYFETVTATDTASATTSIMITIVVSPPPSLVGTSRIETSKGVVFKSPLYAISGGTGTLTMSVTNSPSNANISLTGVTSGGGYLQVGSASETGTYTSTIRVTDARGAYSEMAITVVVNAPVTLSGSLSITKTYGTSTTNGYSTNGSGTAPFTFSATPVCAVVKTVSGAVTYEKVNGTDGCTWTAPAGVTAIDALLVGAGGGGGADGGAGGGGGSINTLTSVSLPANRQLSVQVGAGGTGGVFTGAGATNGGTTSVVSGSTTYTAPGGSAGGGCGAAASAGGTTGNGGSPTAGGNGGYGATGTGCSAGTGGAGSSGPTSSFTGTSVTYGGGGGGGPFPDGLSPVGLKAGGAGGGGTGTQASGQNSYGLPTYFRALSGTPSNATAKEAFTSGTCGSVTGNIGYSTDSEFPCSQKNNFQGYATGYFVAPYTGSITFYLTSDDSSDLVININGTNNELQLSDCCRTASTTWSGFIAGQAYPISVYFTEITGLAQWKLDYSYTGVSQTTIPLSQFRSGSAGLATYFRANNSTSALSKNTFTSGTCAQILGNIDFANDAAFPCDGKDNFQGYATGYFVAPYTGSITFTMSSDDSSVLSMNINGTNNETQLSIGSTTFTWSGFVKGQFYPMSAFFTEITGAAVWRLEYEYTGQSKIAIPTSALRSNTEYVAPTAGTNGLGGGGGAGSAGLYKVSGAQGGSGTVVLKYATQSDTATETMITAYVNQESPSGLLTLNVPAYVPVGTYTETITVQDAANSAPYTATVRITVNKATPTATLSLPGGVTTAKYGTPVTLSVAASTPGNIAFKKAGSAISGCSSVATSNGVATCIWTPSVVESTTITALLSPTDSNNYNVSNETSTALSINVGKADTLTITANTPSAITYSSPMTLPANGFTTSGLKPIDTITAVSYAYWSAEGPTCATGGTCAVGDIGPAGGVVFYVSPTEINSATGISTGGKYLEAAPTSTLTTYSWCNTSTTIGANGLTIGSGAENTRIIAAACSGGAGATISNLTQAGYSDWFLPSFDEASEMSKVYAQIGMNTSNYYWTSTEYTSSFAYALGASRGTLGGSNKSNLLLMWPVRAFSPVATMIPNPSDAGTYFIIPSAPTFTSGAASNYSIIEYTAGTLVIKKAPRTTWSTTYNNATNTTRYGVGKTETATVTYPGDGTKAFTTSSSTCSVDLSSGTLTTLGVGSCGIQVVLSETKNWLSDTKTVTVTIDRGLRSATVTPALSTIKYGETTTVTSAVLPALDSATVTYSSNNSLGCAVDNITGQITGIKASVACSIRVTFDQTGLYESATATASITINKATAPVVTTDSITAVSYTGLTAIVSPTYTVTGILARDIAQILPLADVSSTSAINSIAANTYSSVASYRYFATNPTSYDSTTAPSLGGTYAVSPQSLTLLSGVEISNYETPTYVSSNFTILPIAQAPLVIQLSYLESVTVPYDVSTTGGSSSGSRTLTILPGGTAEGCAVDAGISLMRLKTSTAGTCIIKVTQAADRNYLVVESDSQTVNILNFVVNILQLFDRPTGIVINHEVPFVKGPDVCTVNCQPTITQITDASGNDITTITVGTPFRIIGTNFTTATGVFFTAVIGGSRKSAVPGDSFQIDSDTQITVMPPVTFVPNAGETVSNITVRIYVMASGGQNFPNTSITAISL